MGVNMRYSWKDLAGWGMMLLTIALLVYGAIMMGPNSPLCVD